LAPQRRVVSNPECLREGVRSLMVQPVIVDMRNIYRAGEMKARQLPLFRYRSGTLPPSRLASMLAPSEADAHAGGDVHTWRFEAGRFVISMANMASQARARGGELFHDSPCLINKALTANTEKAERLTATLLRSLGTPLLLLDVRYFAVISIEFFDYGPTGAWTGSSPIIL
jgi:hypothetical protein